MAVLISLLISVVLIIINSTDSSGGRPGVVETGNNNMGFIRRSCGFTTYPALCISSLSAHANLIQTSPILLSHTALSLSLEASRSTSATMVLLSQSHRRLLSPREAAAMKDCVEVLGDSVEQLRRSLDEMNRLKSGPNNNNNNYGLMINNIQTWVSAALTDEDTCTEGFKGTPDGSAVKSQVSDRILNVVHMTSNALALIAKLKN